MSTVSICSRANGSRRCTPMRARLWVLVGKRDLYRLDGDSPELVASLDDGSRHVPRWSRRIGVDRRRPRGAVAACATRGSSGLRHSTARPPMRSGTRHGVDRRRCSRWPPTAPTSTSACTSVGSCAPADGTSWTPTIDLHDDVHQVAVGPDGTVWAATGMRGLAESNDRGATWRYHTRGLHATYLLAVAVVNDAVLVGASSGHAGRDGAVYRFDGSGFARASGLPDQLERCRRATPARWRRRPCRRGAARR